MIQEIFSSWKMYSLSLINNWEIKSCFVFILGCLSEFTRLPNVILDVFFASLFIDFILGVISAIRLKLFSFCKFKRGISKIALYVFYVILMTFGDKVFQELFSLEVGKHYLALWLAGSIILTELLSILNHCRMLGLPIPSSMALILTKAKENLDCSKFEMSNKNNEKKVFDD